MFSILAGLFIGLAAIVNLSVGGGVIGALLFSFGLLSILLFKFELFTGQAGKLATMEIHPWKLTKVWFGNLMGTFVASLFIINNPSVMTGARAIIEQRSAVHPLYIFLLAIPCGILMFTAVSAWKESASVILTILPVAVFILSGYCHCVADMAYMWMGCYNLNNFLTALPRLIAATAGNIVGCNIIPYCLQGTK